MPKPGPWTKSHPGLSTKLSSSTHSPPFGPVQVRPVVNITEPTGLVSFTVFGPVGLDPGRFTKLRCSTRYSTTSLGSAIWACFKGQRALAASGYPICNARGLSVAIARAKLRNQKHEGEPNVSDTCSRCRLGEATRLCPRTLVSRSLGQSNLICTYIHIYIYLFIYLFLFLICIYLLIYLFTCIYIYIYVCIYLFIYLSNYQFILYLYFITHYTLYPI